MVENLDNTFRQENCPLCNSSNVYFIGELKYTSRVLFSSHKIDLGKVPELWKCVTCYSWYTNNILPESIAADLYKTGISADRWSQTPIVEGKSKEIIKLLAEIYTNGKKVLDIGCNTGEVLDFAKDMGCITTGVDFSSACQNQLEEKGHEYFTDLEDLKSRYDVITVFDIIEHIYNLPLFFDQCKKLLVNDGVILILTGDIHSLSARLCKTKWWYVNYPEHIVFPSKIFFQTIPGFRVCNRIKTYAAVNYKRPSMEIIRGFLKGIYKGNYTGLPSIGPDHVLYCLSKR